MERLDAHQLTNRHLRRATECSTVKTTLVRDLGELTDKRQVHGIRWEREPDGRREPGHKNAGDTRYSESLKVTKPPVLAARPQAVTNLRAFELVGKDSLARSNVFQEEP